MISQNLLTLRKRNHYSQEDVAAAVGVSRQTIAKWECGESTPDISYAAKLAELYGVTLDELVTFREGESYGLEIPPKGKHIFGSVRVGERGQIVIPVKARRLFHIQPGDELILLGDDDQGLALLPMEHFKAIFDIIQEHRKGAQP